MNNEVKKAKRIRTMRWTGNNFGNEGTTMISEALKSNGTLTELELGCDKKKRKGDNKQVNG